MRPWMPSGSSWWNSFHSAVDQGGSGAVSPGGRMVSNKGAVVAGLIGLDSEHGAYSELHPTYAMAIHTDSSVTDDQWAFFARNWGDEGFCSQDQLLGRLAVDAVHSRPGQRHRLHSDKAGREIEQQRANRRVVRHMMASIDGRIVAGGWPIAARVVPV